MRILYHDKDIVVCVKPVGVLSAADASGAENLPDLLKKDLGVSEVFPIHRLDREVSGLMVFALNKKAAASLSSQAADHTRFVKEYIAVVEGAPDADEGVLEDLLFKDSSKNKTFVVKRERRGVKKAKLSYKVIEKREGCSVARVRLYTGRTHQIRVQFASRKMPLLGDRKYGGAVREGGIALYSVLLSFIHPASGKTVCFELLPEKI